MEKLVNEARESIGQFCLEECNALCCRKGYLTLDDTNVNIVCENKQQSLDSGKLKKVGSSYHLDMNKGCVNLNGPYCRIHKNPKRPNVCKEFPLFIEGNKIKLSPACPAVRENKMYPYIAILLKNGFLLAK